MIELRSDQREVAKRLVEMLKTHPVVGFQAPTGWGKTPTVLEVVKEFGGPALWLAPRLSIVHHVYVHAVRMGMRVIATAGREGFVRIIIRWLISYAVSAIDAHLTAQCLLMGSSTVQWTSVK